MGLLYFTLAGSDVYEMVDFAGPLSSQPPFLPVPYRDSKRSSARPDLLNPHLEA